MYNEKERFSVRDIVIQILFVVLFVFILLGLFPTKSYFNNLNKNDDNNINFEKAFEPLYIRIFNENLLLMTDAAQSYWTIERLPKKVGEKVKLTLSEMLNKKLLMPFVDSKGKQCDLQKSYVEITKTGNEFVLKINLSCSDYTDYLLVPMGCYNFCSTEICEKPNTVSVTGKQTTLKPSNEDETKGVKPSPKPEDNKPEDNKPSPKPEDNKPNPKPEDNKPVPKPEDNKLEDKEEPKIEYLYEYKLTTKETYSNWSNWSDWGTDYIRATDLVDVQTEVKSEKITKLIGHNVVTKKVPYTEQEKIVIDNKVTITCDKWDTVYEETGKVKYGTEWKYKQTVVLSSKPQDTNAEKFIEIGQAIETSSYYRVYTRDIFPIKQGGYQCVSYGVKSEPVYDYKTVTKYKTVEEKEPVYGNIIKNTTYYRSRFREFIPAKVDLKWSLKNDLNLLKSGYILTGNKKVN